MATGRQNTILFAGGGTGGHIFPGIAIAERLMDRPDRPSIHFICSKRWIDRRVLTQADMPFTASPVKPLPPLRKPWLAAGFLAAYVSARMQANLLISQQSVSCIVAMGGFVSGPVAAAARAKGIPVVLVNLDAEPGKANRWLAGSCAKIYSVYPTGKLPEHQIIGLPLRRSCMTRLPRPQARERLGLDPELDTLLITGASQGAESLNRLMESLAAKEQFREAMRGWQVLHLAGGDADPALRQAYQKHAIRATVLPFSDEMGLVWKSADLAISRAGANSVAEIVANGVPAVFLPYPYHKDEHQKLNAQPLIEAAGAVLYKDRIDPEINAARLLEPLIDLMANRDRRDRMRESLLRLVQPDGARIIADAAIQCITP